MGMLTHPVIEDTLNDIAIESQRLKMDYDDAKENLPARIEMRPAAGIHDIKMLAVRAGKIAALGAALQLALNSVAAGAQQKLNADQLAAASRISG